MEKQKNKKFLKANRVFNTPLDVGLRALFLLAQTKKSFDLQSLVYLDYFLIHSGDVPDGPKSLHPAASFRAGEILIKREIMKEGLRLMHLKQLLDVIPQKNGIYYSKNKLTEVFIKNYSDTEYTEELKKRAKWVIKNFGRFNEIKLKNYVEENLTKWGVEFTTRK